MEKKKKDKKEKNGKRKKNSKRLIDKEIIKSSGFIHSLYGDDEGLEIKKKGQWEVTRRIIRIIGKKKLIQIMDIYKIYSYPYPKEIKHSKNKYPKKDLDKINKVLDVLHYNNWLTDEAFERIKQLIKEQILFSEKGIDKVISDHLRKSFQTGGRRIDTPLNLLIVILVESLKSKTGRPHYRLVTEFLTEQDIIDSDMSEEAIKKACTRNIENVKKINTLLKELVNIEKLSHDLHAQLTTPKEGPAKKPKLSTTTIAKLLSNLEEE